MKGKEGVERAKMMGWMGGVRLSYRSFCGIFFFDGNIDGVYRGGLYPTSERLGGYESERNHISMCVKMTKKAALKKKKIV